MSGRGRAVRLVALVVVGAALTAACSSPAASTRPTDPRELAKAAITTTAALETARLHVEVAADTAIPDMSDAGGPAGGQMHTAMAVDADANFAGRTFAGRMSMKTTGAGLGLGLGDQTADIIATRTRMFTRLGGQAKWISSEGSLNMGPSNAAIGSALAGMLDDPRVTLDKGEAAACSLGTCDVVVVHLPREVLATVIGGLTGGAGGADALGLPDLDLELRIDQATLVVSEVRSGLSMNGSSGTILLTLAQPNAPVTIVAPAANLIDDTTGGFGPGGGVILETVGTEVGPATPAPMAPSGP
jgi:hypothetical protein